LVLSRVDLQANINFSVQDLPLSTARGYGKFVYKPFMYNGRVLKQTLQGLKLSNNGELEALGKFDHFNRVFLIMLFLYSYFKY